MNIIIGYITTYLYLILVLFISTIFQKKYNLKEETSRKLVHILVGLSWFIMIYFFSTSWHLVIPPLTFIIINYISYKKDLISSMERTDKNSKGTIYFAISFALLALITVTYPKFLPFYGIGALTMTFGDGLAPFIGVKFNKYHIGKTSKTYCGSLFILITTIIISIIFNHYYFLGFSLLDYIIIGITASILEFIGFKGTDNLSLPIGVAIISFLLTI